MNTLLSFTTLFGLTFLTSMGLTRYLRPYLLRVLLDLCHSKEPAQFWTAFSNGLLIGLPAIIKLKFHPEASTLEGSFFEVFGLLAGNLAGYMFMLIGIGLLFSFSALVAPESRIDGQ